MKYFTTFILLLLLCNCKQKQQNSVDITQESQREVKDSITHEERIEIQKMFTVKDKSLKNFTYYDVAKFAIASLMGQTAKTMKVRKNKEVYLVSYKRKSDNQNFEYKVKFDNNKVLWGNSDGRWRDSDNDEKISFSENETDSKINIIQTFSDGSKEVQEFKK